MVIKGSPLYSEYDIFPRVRAVRVSWARGSYICFTFALPNSVKLPKKILFTPLPAHKKITALKDTPSRFNIVTPFTITGLYNIIYYNIHYTENTDSHRNILISLVIYFYRKEIDYRCTLHWDVCNSFPETSLISYTTSQ